MTNFHSLRLSLQSWLALLALALTVWFTINYTALLLELLWILFGAVLLSALIRPVAARLDVWHIPRGLTVIGAYLVMGGLLLGMVWLLAPIVQIESSQMRMLLPSLAQQMQATFPPSAQIATELTNLVNSQGNVLLLDALGIASSFSTLLLDLVLVFILAYFLTTMISFPLAAFDRWAAPAQRHWLQAIGTDSYNRLTHWVWIQFALSLYYAIAFITGLWLLQVPFALTIGLLGGVLSLIPYLGVAFAALLAILSVLPIAPWSALWVAIFMTVVTVIGSHLIMPVFYGRAIGIHAAVVLIALFIGAKVQGLVGIVFAVPVVVIFSSVFAHLPVASPPLPNAAPNPSDPPLYRESCHELYSEFSVKGDRHA